MTGGAWFPVPAAPVAARAGGVELRRMRRSMPAFFAPAPASQRQGACQQHAAAQSAQRDFVILAVQGPAGWCGAIPSWLPVPAGRPFHGSWCSRP